jgi:hypothetical protein
VLAALTEHSPARVVDSLVHAAHYWDAVIAGVASGDSLWLKVYQRLIPNQD